jgi:putative membrane protein
MKKRFWLLTIPFIFMACNNGSSDSVAKADSTNEAKSDSNNTGDNSKMQGGALGVNEASASFMTGVADVGMAEVKLGQLAKEKGTNTRIKAFGEMMVRDHSKANDELKALAGKKNVTLPATIGDAHQKKYDDLSKKSGKDFDKAYINAMVDGHQSAVDNFKNNADNSDADVKEWVNKTLPTLQMHLDSAKAIKKALKY